MMMRKRILAVLLCLCLLAGLCVPAYAEDTVEPPAGLEALEEAPPETKAAAQADTVEYPVEGGNIYFNPVTGAITDCDNTVIKADIPSSINGVAVTSIGGHAFYRCSELTSITIPVSVTSIGDSAFNRCSGLTSITIPASVTNIEYGAFSGCNGFTSAGKIGSGCDYQFGWTDVIPSNAFSFCSGLTSITIPDSVTSIGHGAFNDCSGLTSITIPDSVTSIEDFTFRGCSNLTSITIPASVTSIGDGAFKGCSGLTSIAMSNNVNSIKHGAFEDCSGLTSIAIPDSVTSIESSSFRNCGGLTSVTIPDGITSIGQYAFDHCSKLTSITIPDSVTSIDDGAFKGCSKLTSVIIPSSVTNIGDEAFSGCNGLSSAGEIGSGCDYQFGWTNTIPTHAFEGCRGLTSVTIPDSVTSIGDEAFFSCGLRSITIPNNVTSIGDSAFGFCWFTSVTIPDSVTSIGDSAFRDCSLTSVTLSNSITKIADRAFSGCEWLTSVTIPDSVTSIGVWAFSDCSRMTSVTIPDTVVSIGYGAFSGCGSITSIIIPDSVTTIEEYAFRYCSGLTSITIPNSVTSIGSGAFFACSGLTEVYYSGSEMQWKAIAVDIDNDPLTSAVIHYGSSSEEDEGVEINTDAYYTTPEKCLFRIRPISTEFRNPAGFRVKVGQETFSSGNTTCTSTDDVTVLVPKGYDGNIEIALEGYHTNYLPASWTGGTNTVAMTPETVTKPYLRAMLVRTGRPTYPVYTNLATDYKRCELSVYKPGLTGTAKPLEYYTSVDWNGHGEGTVWMEQGSKKISLTNDGVVKTAIESEFDSGKTIYLCAEAADGTTLRKSLRIQINEPVDDGFKFDLGSKTTAKPDTENDTLRILQESQSLEINFSSLSNNRIPIKYSLKRDGTVKGTIGVEIASGSYSEAAYGKVKEAYDTLMDPRYAAQNVDLAKELSNLKKQKILLKEYPHSSFGVKGNVQILGYFTGKLNDGQFRVTEMKGAFIINGSVSYTHNTTVWGIPAHFKVSLAAKLEAGISMKYNQAADTYIPADELPAAASISVSAQAGPGWEGFATLAAKGSGTLKSYFSLPIRDSKTMWTIAGNLSFVGSVGGISGEWTFLKSPEMVFWDDGNAVWYEKGSKTAPAMAFKPDLSRSVMTYAGRMNGNALVTGVSGYTAPGMAALPDGRLLAVWTADVPGRSAVDKNGIYYSLRTEGEWSAPQLVWDDGTNDSVPELWTAGDSVWLTWQNYTKIYNADSLDGISGDNITSQITITAAEFDSSSNRFSPQNIPCDTYGYAPQMRLADGQTELAWMDNDGSFWTSAYTGTSWSDAVQLDNVNWYEDEVSLPSTYEGEISGSNATVQTFSTNDYQAILYTDADENGISNVYGLFNDGHGWGDAIPLTDNSVGNAGGFSAVMTEDNTLQILVNTVYFDEEGSYQSADLEFYEKTLQADLTVNSVDYVHDTLAPGGTLTITADVTNNSAQTVSGLAVSLDSSTSDCAVTLLPGERKTVYVNYALPDDFQSEIHVSVYPQDGNDADGTDNDAVCTLNLTDISLEEVLAEQLVDETLLTAMIVNRGSTNISSYTVSYRMGAPDGTVIAEEAVDQGLTAGEAVYLSTSINKELEPGTMIYADVSISNDSMENLYGNNSDCAVVTQAVNRYDLISAEIVSSGEGQTVVQLTDPQAILHNEITIFAASYSDDGQMLKVVSGSLQQEGVVTFTENIAPGWTMFFLNSQSEPVCSKVVLE